MSDEICGQTVESLRLPKGWRSSVRNAVLNLLGIVRIAMLTGREAHGAKRKASCQDSVRSESTAALLSSSGSTAR
jgi:hypothetical protein